MKIYSVNDPLFHKYGQILEGYDTEAITAALDQYSELPETGTKYFANNDNLMAQPFAQELENRAFGGMPIQIGHCNGRNTKLNALEYHRDSELNLGTADFILLLGKREEVEEDGLLDTEKVVAFKVPAGVLIEVYATTLHYCPCSAKLGQGFKVLVVLPKGTNTAKPVFEAKNHEDELMTARNKWLLPHPEVSAKNGTKVGLKGINIDIAADI